MPEITVSVILPTCNRARLVLRSLEALLDQDFPRNRFEIIVVNDGSTDDTHEVLSEFLLRIQDPRIQYVVQNRGGPSSARNAGVRLARGEIMAFTEDDVFVEKDWIKNAIPYFVDECIGGVEGVTFAPGGTELLRLPSLYPGFIPCNIFYRNIVMQKVGPFDTSFYDPERKIYFREDADMGFRVIQAGWRVVRVENVRVYHPKLFLDSSGLSSFAKRYYFDALLYKKHRSLYRKMIEVKKVGPIVVKRPFHYLSLINVISLLFVVVFMLRANVILAASISCYLISLAGIIYKFLFPDFFIVTNEGLLKPLVQLVRLPFVYFFWFTKGCLHFRSMPYL